ncbi:alanine racemase [Candidatus Fermentibacteria bacterium]|nr:alanine racemase [Candidatus Fermentibacteria bacterium]
MNRVTIDLHALKHNLGTIKGWMDQHPATWTVVTKVLCGHADTLRALQVLGVRSMGDSRLENLEAIDRIVPDFESWYVRVSDLSSVAKVARFADVSLNSEVEVIRSLNDEAKKLDRIHKIIIMIELGDLREGILPGSLVKFYERVFELPNVEVLGIGANLGCLAGAVPNVDQFTQLALYRELLELKFHRKLPMISAGSSAVLPLLLEGKLPRAINHFRIGEAIFLGTDLVNGGSLPTLRNDVVLLDAEIAEIKEKGLVPLSETAVMTPFDSESDESLSPGQRGYRALVSVGQLDTEIGGLTPVDPRHRIAGASSDITVVNLGDDPNGLQIGGTIRFRVNYAAMLRLMSSKYIAKIVIPSLSEFKETLETDRQEIMPAVESLEQQTSG